MNTYIFNLYISKSYGSEHLGKFVSQAETIDQAMNKLSEEVDLNWYDVVVSSVYRVEGTIGQAEKMEV